MAIISSCFVPKNNDIYNLILNFLFFEMQNTKEQQIINHIKYIFVRMIRIKGKERHHVPSEEELGCIEKLIPIDLPVKFFTGNQTNVKVESYTTIRDLKCELMNRLDFNIQRAIYYSIYEICEKKSGTEERFIDDGEKVCDILSVWKKETENYKKKNINIEFKFFLKLVLYYEYNPEDIDAVTMTYVQSNFEVIKGRFKLTEPEILKLGAIQLFIDFGHLGPEQAKSNLKENVKQYVPVKKIQANSESSWAAKIMEEYNNLNFRSKLEAKNAYLNILKNNELFQSCQFICTYDSKLNTANNNSQRVPNPNHIPEQCIVAVKPQEIIITDVNRNKIYNFPLTVVASWGVNSELFVIVEKKGDKDYSKSYFLCNQPKLFKIIIDSYTNVMIGKNMVEIMTERVETCKLFESLPYTKLKPGESLRTRQATIYDV